MTERIKTLKGPFICPYRVFRIKFPSMTEVYIYAGPPVEAEKFAKRIKKKKKFPYKYKIKEITL